MKRIKILYLLAATLILQVNCSFGATKTNPKKPAKAFIGVHLMNIYSLDMTTNSFYGDFYLWCKWKGDLDPLENIEFVNSIDKWGFTSEMMYDSTIILDDGFNYNVMHCEGRFFYSFK